MTAWFWISAILGVIWVIVFLIGVGFGLLSEEVRSEDRKEYFQIFSAIMAGAALFVVAHWIVLLLIIPVFICYGLWSAAKLLKNKPWKVDTAR